MIKGVPGVDWLDKVKNKVKETLKGDGHLAWEHWIQIWLEMAKKESIPTSPWFEFETGADSEGIIFQKLHWGLKSELGKITLEVKKNKSVHIFKKNNEICSLNLDKNKDKFEKVWGDLLIESYRFQQGKMEEFLTPNRLGIVDEKKLNDEEVILKWFQATHKILKGAIDQARANYGQFVTARILMGTVPMTKEFSVQIHCFNIEEVLMNTSSRLWKVLAFDHALNNGKELKRPSLTGGIEIQVRQLWAEMQSLINHIFKI